MTNPKLYEREFQLCQILWKKGPVTLRELTYLCKEYFNWERSTTYTMVQRLTRKGVIKKAEKVVTTVLSCEQIQDVRMNDLIQGTFDGQLPDFLRSLSRVLANNFDFNKRL